MPHPPGKITALIQDKFYHGSKTVSTAAVALAAVSNVAQIGVLIKADPANSGTVYIGHTDVVTADTVAATDGFPLSAGDAVVIPIENGNSVYAVASGAGQKVFWLII